MLGVGPCPLSHHHAAARRFGHRQDAAKTHFGAHTVGRIEAAGAELGWHDIEIDRKDTGAPFVRLHGKALDLMARRNARRLHVSLSHTQVYAVATALLED